MPRIILTAGKGGVGKSTVAAATAALCARQGLRVLAMSIDSAHNLGDLFQTPLGHTPTHIAERIHGLEVDINRELAENWHSVTDFLRSMSANNPSVSELVAEECAVLPGMEEVFGLMRLQTVVEAGEFDVIVLDAPPTGDLLKFLRLPDVLQWFMQKYHPLDRGFVQRLRPFAEAVNFFVPAEETVAEMEFWYRRVQQASATLTDLANVSVRLVMTPDRVGLAETRRAMSWTCLLGMNVDAVVVNKVLPAADYPPFFGPWLARQEEVLAAADEAFTVPVLHSDLRQDEILGLEALAAFGDALYAGRDPSALWCAAPPLRWEEEGDGGVLSLRLPFLRKGQFRLLSGREGLSLMVGNQRHVIPLPSAIRRRPMRGAKYEGGWLHIRFGD